MSFLAQATPHEQIIQDYLATVYQDLPASNTSQSILAHTSGEILFPSLNSMLRHISLTADDVLVDLGSGRGNLVLEVFLTQQLRKVLGIEIREDLHHQALQAWQRLTEDLSTCLSGRPDIEFLLADFLTAPLAEASIAIINATCFGPELMQQLADKIQITPSIHTVFSLRPLVGLQRLTCQKIISVQCSWDTALCYIYCSNSLKKSPAIRKLR